MKTIAEKIIALNGELAGPASPAQVAEVETRLSVQLPHGLREFLVLHNGSTRETDEASWMFWPCAEIASHAAYRGKPFFVPNYDDLRSYDPAARTMEFPGENLVLFADALIDAPTYGIFLQSGHRFHGFVFETSFGYVSARSFDEWALAFVDRAEEGLIIPD